MKALRGGVVEGAWSSLGWGVVVDMEKRKSGPLEGQYVPHLQCVAVASRDSGPVAIDELRASLSGIWVEVVGCDDAQHGRHGVFVEWGGVGEASYRYLVAQKKCQSREEREAVLDEWPDGIGKAWHIWNEEALPFAPVVEAHVTSEQCDAARETVTGAVRDTQRAIGSDNRVSRDGWGSLTTDDPAGLLAPLCLEWKNVEGVRERRTDSGD